MEEMRNAYKILVGKPEGKSHFEDLGVEGKIISERILWKQDGKVWTGCNWFRTGTSDGFLEIQ
jgi:hypothetical protein